MNRRHFLRTASALSLGAACPTSLSRAAVSAAASKPRKILFFTKSSGFEHSVISYKQGQPSLAEKTLQKMAPTFHWDLTFSKDGSLFTPEYLAGFDAYFFFTTGNLCEPGTDGQPPMTPAGKQALIGAVHGGKGFIGSHSAADTFHTSDEKVKGPDRYLNHGDKADPYIRMLGGEFIIHGKQQKASMRCVDNKFPGMGKVGEGFEWMEEWYTLKDFSDDLHVLLIQDTKGMEGAPYQRPPFPATWARKHGTGRVFYTSMGHRDDVWANPIFQEIIGGGVQWATGNLDADVTPNIKSVTPKADENEPYPAKATPAAAAPPAK